MNLRDISIEITRRCNMDCDHCLRGDSEQLDIDHKHITSLLSQVEYISVVTFTGGEPSLNVNAIEFFIEECKRLDVSIGSFYIATNGLKIKENFVIACLKLFSMSDEKDMCSVEVSNDSFHAFDGYYNTELLEGLSFFSKKYNDDNYNYNNYTNLIQEGKGRDYDGRENDIPDEIETKEDLNDIILYLNVHGEIINGCDWSYDTQDKGDYVLCNVDDLKEFVESLED